MIPHTASTLFTKFNLQTKIGKSVFQDNPHRFWKVLVVKVKAYVRFFSSIELNENSGNYGH